MAGILPDSLVVGSYFTEPCGTVITWVKPLRNMMSKKLLTSALGYLIQPEHINTDPSTGGEGQHFFGAFDNTETEVSARYLVRMAQKRGQGWAPFSFEDIEAFYNEVGNTGFTFNRLVNPEQVYADAGKAFEQIAMAGNLGAAIMAQASQPKISVGGGWIVQGDDDKYYFTHEFIACCFKASPAASSFSTVRMADSAQSP